MESETDSSSSVLAKFGNDLHSKGEKRKNTFNQAEKYGDTAPSPTENELCGTRPHKICDPFAIPQLLHRLDWRKFGSVTEEIEALQARKMQMLNSIIPFMQVDVEKKRGKELFKLANQQATHWPHCDVVNLEDDDPKSHVAAVDTPVVILDSDDEGDGYLLHSHLHQRVAKIEPDNRSSMNAVEDDDGGYKLHSQLHQKVVETEPGNRSPMNTDDDEYGGHQLHTQLHQKVVEIETGNRSPMNTDDDEDSGHQLHTQLHQKVVEIEPDDRSPMNTDDDGLADVWKEMMLALECSKGFVPNPSTDEHIKEDVQECDHSFVLKDDLGYVCRICGLIQRSIDTIFEFQYYKGKRCTRSYAYESEHVKDTESTDVVPVAVKSPADDLMVTKIAAHPMHLKEMKPHQVEGFNFLCNNLVTDKPGGCILAHSPGSGKTFMIISFIHSFLAKYPDARPLIILPKGILGTWKKEFQIWKVEDIPLHDFYALKAESRSQQLEVLKKWVKERGILFLGYKQFSAIVCDDGSSKVAADCQDILLKVPSILILDEGHTPRNEETDVLKSLARIQTPLKVVLSGTLYQNHVKEVFNILNLVRPKFIKYKTSRGIVNRIMSRVQILAMRKHLKAGADLPFFDLVEYTLQTDEDLKRRMAVIQDLREMTGKVLHYYKGDFLDELPGLVDFTVVLNLSARQKDEVQKLRKFDKFKQISLGSIVYMHPQMKCLSQKYLATGERGSVVDDEKIDAILEKLDVRDGVKLKFVLNILHLCESAGEKLLVFSQYILPLKLLERLSAKVKGWSPGKETFMITGDSNTEHREWCMERFNGSPDAKIFFGSIKACGEGISLVGASRILILDVHLNPSVTRQAIGRAFRPGQKKKVYVYRLVAADSPEQEDYLTCSKKELISKMWFEWNENCGDVDFETKTIDVNESCDVFFESPALREDLKVLYRR